MSAHARSAPAGITVGTTYTKILEIELDGVCDEVVVRLHNAGAVALDGLKLQTQEHPDDDPTADGEWLDYIATGGAEDWAIATLNLSWIHGTRPDTLGAAARTNFVAKCKARQRLRVMAKVGSGTTTIHGRLQAAMLAA
jgi:hypothetical protein